MKTNANFKIRLFLLSLFVLVTAMQAQSQNEKSTEFLDQLTNETIILNANGILRGTDNARQFVVDFIGSDLDANSYKKIFSIEVSTNLEYEIGQIQANAKLFSVMFPKRKDPTTHKIELLVIYQEKNPVDASTVIDITRNNWMELCNAHQANELVKQLYTADAYYYNRGRLLQGTEALSAEYSYMNSPQYSLKLTPHHVLFVSAEIAYEIGQCSGSYPLPYMLLWEKQSDGNWQIKMDSNY